MTGKGDRETEHGHSSQVLGLSGGKKNDRSYSIECQWKFFVFFR